MPWARFDDRYPSHRKVRPLSDAAFRLDVSAVCWSNENLTDGYIATDELSIVSDVKRPAKAAEELVLRGRWEKAEGGWAIHDFLVYNPAAERVRAEREWEKRRQALSRDPDLRAAVQRRDRDFCRYCGRKVNWKDRRSNAGGTYDHVIPRGPDTLENIVTACRGCNSAKGNRTPEQAGMRLLKPGQQGAFDATESGADLDPDSDPTQNGSRSDQSFIQAPSRPVPDPTRAPSSGSEGDHDQPDVTREPPIGLGRRTFTDEPPF